METRFFETPAEFRAWLAKDHATATGLGVVHEPDAAAEAPTTVTWEIAPQEGGICRLTVTHEGFASYDSPTYLYSHGWTWILSGLETLLETGRPLAASA